MLGESFMEICRSFDQTFKDHFDGVRPGGDKIYTVFDNQLPAHIIALEQGYYCLIESIVDVNHSLLEDLVHKVVSETRDLKQ